VARLALIDGAERTLDVQYYLWDSDAVGYLLLDRLIAAADRGVRVRMLVDDLKFRRRTRSIASLCLHSNLEIRLFNPWTRRSNAVSHALEFVRRFGRLDQRMHNKLLVADSERAVFGGRNIAVEHFGLAETFNVVDFDVLLDGRGVSDLSRVFEAYWASPASVAGRTFDDSVSAIDLLATRNFLAEQLKKWAPTLKTVLAETESWDERLRSISKPLAEGAISVTCDTPDPSPDTERTQVIEALRSAVDSAKRDVVVITPFFVPSDVDIEWYQQLVDRGVRLRVLTNSLASNQGTISNSGLKKQRPKLVNAGVELHELRTDAAAKSDWEIQPQVGRYLGLHAKLYVIDSERVLLGSVNLDPRSKFINTEMGVLIRNVDFAEEAAEAIIRLMGSDNSWQIEVGPDERVRWRNDTETVRRQPARGPGQRAADWLLGLLPIRDYI
jgi:putative cardiolipin synthase